MSNILQRFSYYLGLCAVTMLLDNIQTIVVRPFIVLQVLPLQFKALVCFTQRLHFASFIIISFECPMLFFLIMYLLEIFWNIFS